MPSVPIRMLIAAVFLVFMYLALPLLYSLIALLGVVLPSALQQLIGLVMVVVAIYYVITGTPRLWS